MQDFLHKLPQFIGNHAALAALFAILLIALIVVQVGLLFGKSRELTPAGLTQLINRDSPLLIDLSAIADFEKMHVPGARHVLMSQFDPEHKDLAKARELPVVVMDKDGRGNSAKASQRLVKAGFQKVYTLGGGVVSWQQAQLPVYLHRGETDVLKIAREALEFARANNRNTLIFDTAGRLQIDQPLVQELVRLRDLVKPQEILLVLDSATGQEAVNVATHFDQALSITGSVLTKLDGDARGGAALSLKAVTGKPIKFAGTGEKLEDFEAFHPERMATRILGMGDVVSLVEKAAEAVDVDEAMCLEEKMRKGQFSLEDFLDQLRQMKKLGSLESIVKMLPGRTEDQKRKLADALTQAVIETLNSQDKSISVSIEDVPEEEWTRKVYIPDIQDKPDLVYKKPGYDPFA